mgnify:FL=1
MGTLIVNKNGNESVKADLKFRILRTNVNKARYDMVIHDSYSKAKSRIDTLKNIFKGAWNYEIVIVE